MPTGHIPILQIKTKDGEWLPVNAIGGQVASKVLYNDTYVTVEQALDYLFANGTGGGGGASTAEDISYTLPEDIQNEFPGMVELESNTVKSGLDFAMYYALMGLYANYIMCELPANEGTVEVDLQSVINAWMPAVLNEHTHDNKSVIDKLSVADGKLQYDGSDVGLKPSQVTSGTSMTLADNTEYRLTDVTELTITYPNGNFECWMRLAFASEGTITVTLPATTQYIGTTPTFANGETWEISIKDGVVIAQRVGDGT